MRRMETTYIDLTLFPPGLVILFKPMILQLGLGLPGDERSVLSKFWKRMLGYSGVYRAHVMDPISLLLGLFFLFPALNSHFCAWGRVEG